MSTRESQPPTASDENPGTWDLGTALITGAAAAAIGAAVATALEAAVIVTMLTAVVLGVVVGALTGYRPLHEEDAVKVDRFDRRSGVSDREQAAK